MYHWYYCEGPIEYYKYTDIILQGENKYSIIYDILYIYRDKWHYTSGLKTLLLNFRLA